jgi:type II secretory pathway component PulF
MKTDEFAFVNRQMAGMLQSGIPLEGALRQVTADMSRGPLRDELGSLESDLAQGLPLAEALGKRRLPPLYVHLMRIGAQSNDLPGALNLVADYYQRTHNLTTRLKGLAVYPLLVLACGLALSGLITLIVATVMGEFGYTTTAEIFPGQDGLMDNSLGQIVALWFLPVLLTLLTAALIAVLVVPRWRNALRDRWPGFKEARLAQIAATLSLLVQRGGNLNDALGLVKDIEEGTPAAEELAVWQMRLAAGQGRFTDFAMAGKFFPPLFLWLVASAGENLAAGFQRAADLYQARAAYRIELMLYAFLPVSVLMLGIMLVGQVVPMLQFFTQMMNALGSFSE